MFEESTGVATATDGTYEGETMTDTTETTAGFISTEPAPAEVPATLKHRGSLTSVVAITSRDKGSRGIEINVHSDSNGNEYKTTIWPPRQWTDNVRITGAELAQLPRPEGVTAAGNPKQSPYERFGRTIASSDGRGELQRLLRAGDAAGRTPENTYTDFDSLVTNLNTALTGIPLVFTTGPDGEPDPQYGFRIKVRSIYPHDAKWEKIRAEDAGGN
jgi:hypothetical protein